MATARGRNNRHVFICSANREKGANVCANHSGVPMDLLEIGIVKTLRESLTPEALAAYVAEREADTSKRDSNARERQQLLDTIGKLQGQEAKLADLIVESSAPAALVTKLKGLQAERETAEARLVEVEDEGRDLHADAALVGRLQAELPDWLDALTSDPASAKAKLRSILATPVAVTPHGSGRDTVWSFEGMSRLDGSLSGSVAHDGAVSRMEAPSAGGPCS